MRLITHAQAICLGAVLLLSHVFAHATTYVLLTIDVETLRKGTPSSDILGIVDDSRRQYGVPKIIEIFDRHHASPTFYFNPYEIATHPESEISAIAREIVSRGHEIELHTHPNPMYRGGGMSDFPVEQQVEILKRGKDLIQTWTGENVLAHRAGAYLANTETLKALERAGILIDASLSPASQSPLAREGVIANDLIRLGPILEIPVTYYHELQFMNWKSMRFLDIESSTLRELKYVLNAFAANGSCVANIMMHSFSATRSGKVDERVLAKLDALLEFIQEHPQLKAVSTQDLATAYRSNQLTCTPDPEFIPVTGAGYTYLRSWERFFDGWKNVAFALVPPAGIALLLVSLVLIARTFVRRRSKQA